MTDADLVAKKLGTIVTCVEQLRTLARPDQLTRDVREERFVERTLQIAIQAALDVAAHVVSDERLGEPETNQELFALLQQRIVLPGDLVLNLRRWLASATCSCTGTTASICRLCGASSTTD